jgi:SLBB domain
MVPIISLAFLDPPLHIRSPGTAAEVRWAAGSTPSIYRCSLVPLPRTSGLRTVQVRRLMVLNIHVNALALAYLSAALSTANPSYAQGQSAIERPQNFETRAELEAQAKTAEASHHRSEAWLIHYRLDRGDFQEGDRIVVKVTRGSTGVSDTLLVRAGKQLQLRQMGEVSLNGVLRSELVPRLSAHIATYLRDPDVQATQLVRVGILGNVGRPGFYYAPADIPLADVLMAAGGPSPTADLNKVLIRRDGDVIVDESNTRTALTNGMSMDFLHMRAGDEISVGQQRQIPWGMIMSGTSAVLGLVIAYTQLHR